MIGQRHLRLMMQQVQSLPSHFASSLLAMSLDPGSGQLVVQNPSDSLQPVLSSHSPTNEHANAFHLYCLGWIRHLKKISVLDMRLSKLHCLYYNVDVEERIKLQITCLCSNGLTNIKYNIRYKSHKLDLHFAKKADIATIYKFNCIMILCKTDMLWTIISLQGVNNWKKDYTFQIWNWTIRINSCRNKLKKWL